MQINLNGIETKVHMMGMIRWLGKWFTPYQMPADFILLNNDQFDLMTRLRKDQGIPLNKRK